MGLKVAMTYSYFYFPTELWKFSTASIYKEIVPLPPKRERKQIFLNQMESLPTPVIFNESSLDESSYLKLKKLRIKLIIIRKNKENKNIATSRS